MLVALAADGGALAGRPGGCAQAEVSAFDRQRPSSQAGRPAGSPAVESAGRHRTYRAGQPRRFVADPHRQTLEQLAPALADPVTRPKPAGPGLAAGQGLLRPHRPADTRRRSLTGARVEERGHVGPVHEAARVDPDRDRYAITLGAGWAFFGTLGVVVPSSSREPVRHHKDSIEDGSHLSGALGRGRRSPRFVDLGLAAAPPEPAPPHHARGPAGFRPAVRSVPRPLIERRY